MLSRSMVDRCSCVGNYLRRADIDPISLNGASDAAGSIRHSRRAAPDDPDDDRDARPAPHLQAARQGDDVEAVRGVDLEVGAGEIFGFLGPNGAGKTTTLRMLATLLTPTSGTATVAGADLGPRARGGPPAHRLRARRAARPTRPRPAAASSSSRAGCTAWTRRAPSGARPRSSRRSTSRPPPTATSSTYSGGMRRRLDVGLGIVHRPAVLFLDEPTTGLDPQARARMWDEIRGLREPGRRSS